MAINPDDPDLFEPRAKADRSITALLSDLASETILLIRQEMALLKAELSEKFSRVGQGATALGAGALIAFSGWLVLLAAAVLVYFAAHFRLLGLTDRIRIGPAPVCLQYHHPAHVAGRGFLADLVQEWEAATAPASSRGVRVVMSL